MLEFNRYAISSFKNSNNLHSIFDILRGVCAIVVFLGHLRGVFFSNYQDLKDAGIITDLFYFLTGFGHEAVIFFFFLSGYFIASVIERDYNKGTFIWTDYLLKRFLRFQVILLPVLLVTCLLDTIALNQSSVYHLGLLQGFVTPKESVNVSLTLFFTNLLSLQSLVGTHYGSNSPLWSLSYEFLYYLIYPVLFLLVKKRLYFYASLLIAIMTLVSPNVMFLFPCWLVGSLFFYTKINNKNIISLLILPLVLLTNRVLELGYVGDLILSISIFLFFSWFRPKLKLRSDFRLTMRKFSYLMASISFSLYLIHMPLIAFTHFLAGKFKIGTIPTLSICIILVVLFTLVLSRLDNKHTVIFDYLKNKRFI
ncbi:acyltransferase family protein [Proteus terrae]|uniref:acyltransferase family protein n=1 Tax=Proteus terrae TaxID=1574161 RepID=UPI001CBD26AA|nr:acyltransferase [Proteus terrae]